MTRRMFTSEVRLERRGITKAEFARRMGIQRQNVNVLFKTNNLEIIRRAAEVLEVPFTLLVSYVDEFDVFDLPVFKSVDKEESEEIDCWAKGM